jgi:hypothetical protein
LKKISFDVILPIFLEKAVLAVEPNFL